MPGNPEPIIARGIRQLRQAGIENPEREGIRLAALSLRQPSLEAFWRENPVWDAEAAALFDDLVARRSRHEPYAYLTGEREFFGLRLFTPRGVLIPRPETEHLVESVLAHTEDSAPLTVVDVGTGSGAVALALVSERRSWSVWASDIGCWPLLVAQVNMVRLGLPLRVFRDDLLSKTTLRFDVIVANLPYIDRADAQALSAETAYEPEDALFPEDGGLALIGRLIKEAPGHLNRRGRIFLEVGMGQARRVQDLLLAEGFRGVAALSDLAGIERVVYGWWPRERREHEKGGTLNESAHERRDVIRSLGLRGATETDRRPLGAGG